MAKRPLPLAEVYRLIEPGPVVLVSANYFIGSQPILKQFFLAFVGIHGDKKEGIQQLEIAADHGHYCLLYTSRCV